ncbi:UNVERIFIED_ORG: peptide/nickel transport system ATP-binding protein [Burkholderia sp. 1263]
MNIQGMSERRETPVSVLADVHATQRRGDALTQAVQPLIRVRQLSVTCAAVQAPVLRELDFALYAGRTLGIVGESGAGKSMIGRVLARQLPAGFEVSGGTVLFRGSDLLALPDADHRAMLGRRIAFIPQEPATALNPVQTIGQHFFDHLRELGVAAGERRARTLAALAEVSLPDPEVLVGKYAFQLSGGMCQRVLIAMAFAGNPDLVVSDEATTALDVTTQAHIVSLMRALQKKHGTSVIFVTHDLGLAAQVCDEVAVLYAGEIMERGSSTQIFRMPRHPYTAALQRANPQLEGPLLRLQPIDGQMPGIGELDAIAGCRLAARCPDAMKICSTTPPAFVSYPACANHGESDMTGAGHSVRCHLAADAARRVPATSPPRPTFAAMTSTPLLTLEGITKTYANRSGWLSRSAPAYAVRGIDLSIAPGEFVGVIGESGSGKSTLARLIMGLETPSGGRIVLQGQPLSESRADWERRIASIQMIFQNPRSALNPRRRIASLLTQAMQRGSHMHMDLTRQAAALASQVGLANDVLQRYPSQVSGGQRQRVNIGRALCDVPQLLVADEIVSGLDVSVQAQILNLLLELRETHKIALLLISHDLAVVRYLCSRVIVMKDGVVVESGETEDVLTSPAHPYTRSLIDSVPRGAQDLPGAQ